MTVIPAICPQCGAQYQLTQEHLAVANGKVRCGVCNTVFQAAAPAAPQAQAQAPKPAANPAAPKSQFVNEDDDILLSDELFEDAPEEKPAQKSSQFSSEFSDFADDSHDSFGASDELDEFDSSGSSPLAKGISSQMDKMDEEDWASKLLEDEGIDTGVLKKEEKKAPAKETPRKALGSSADDFDFDLDGLDGAPLALSQEEQAAYGFGEEAAKDEMIRNIKPEPLVLQLLHKTSLQTSLGMGLLGAVAVLGIVFQLFFFQKDTLSRDPAWHSLYAGVCSILGCDLPPQFNIADIQATNLTVKSHPHYRQALMVDAIIINHANIMQPFPNIELYFTDSESNVVAARQFKPAEYLRGELADASLMPSLQSVHIALEINDPGTNASGYYIKLSY